MIKEEEASDTFLEDFHKIGKNGAYDIIDDKIASYIIEHENIIIIAGKPYIYKDGVYKRDEDGNILKYLIKSMIFPHLVTITKINRVYALIMINHKLAVDTEDVNKYPSHWINFKNGMLDVISGEMHEHSPKYLSVNQIPHNYIPGLEITKSTFYAFIESRIPDDGNKRMLFEFMGYCMTKDVTFQKFMILYGLGESGKSTIINFTMDIVGRGNTCSIPLQQLSDRFTTASLLLKILNTCGDMTNSALTDTGVIKQLTGDDAIKGEYKGGSIFFFRNHAKMMFSCNELPKVLDEKSNGFYRRLLIVGFTESGEYIPDLKAKLSEESEIETVISGCVSALKNALIKGKIFESSGNLEEVERLRTESDTVAAFLNDCAEYGDNLRIRKSTIFNYYVDYCTEEGRKPLGKRAFKGSMEKKGFFVKLKDGYECYRGIDIKWKEIMKPVFD